MIEIIYQDEYLATTNKTAKPLQIFTTVYKMLDFKTLDL